MAWSTINDAYKIQNFNSEQGKRFYKYKTAEPRLETYNIMEGFVEGHEDGTAHTHNVAEVSTTLNNLTPLDVLTMAQRNYIANIGVNKFINTNIFVDRNDTLDETRQCVPRTVPKEKLPDDGTLRPYLSGLWVPGKVPVERSIVMDSGKQTVYMIYHDSLTKMVQWPSKISKYYTGSIDLFKESDWDKYITAPEGNYILNFNGYYNSHQEAITACRSIAANNSPKHDAYGINAYRFDIRNSYLYECTTGRTKDDLYSTTVNNKNDVITKRNNTLYKFITPSTYVPPIRTKFVRSPTSQTYAQHKETCRNSNGKWKMASITSVEDHTAINEVRRLNGGLVDNWTFIGGHRIANNSPIWKWEDRSPWNDAIANGTMIPGCGWNQGEPNNWGGSQSALMLRGTGVWDDISETASLYAIYKESKFMLSPFSGNYEYHKGEIKKSNGTLALASITSLEDHNAIKEIISLYEYKIPILEDNHRWVATGGHRIANNSSVWVWEDGTPWNNNIANGTTIPGCGWQPGRPNDYGGNSNILWVSDTGRWGDAPSIRSSYAIYKEVVNSDNNNINYAASFNNDGTLSFDVTNNVYGDKRTEILSAVKTTDNITLPLPITGCSPLTGGELNKQSINLKYRYKC